jgi:hypothetical protein
MGEPRREKGVNLYHRLTPDLLPEFKLQQIDQVKNRISELKKE